MRLQTLLGWTLAMALPSLLWATAYNEMEVVDLQGTVMVQHAKASSTPTALMTNSTVEKGDTLTCYDKSWVILKTHSGARIGLDGLLGPTIVNVDEFFLEGPDRQIRLVLQQGVLFLKTNGYGSKQSFFEISAGAVVTSVNDTEARIAYSPAEAGLLVQYFTGDMNVIDKDHEEKMQIHHSERHWKSGVMADKEPSPVDDLDWINYKKFFNSEPRVAPGSNNFLLTGE
jgi:hypothetical protein